MSVFLYNERPLATPSVRWGWLKQRTSDTEGWRGKSSTEIDAAPPRRTHPRTFRQAVAKPFKSAPVALVGLVEKNPNE